MWKHNLTIFCKLDILGLKTLSIIRKTLNNIPEIPDIKTLYSKVDINDKNLYKYISSKQTDCIFQIESDMMKGIIGQIKPTGFNDIVAINALGRPGPISVGLNKQYAATKNNGVAPAYPLKKCEHILDETFGVTVYQEQLMQISKDVCGFDDMQADSICRKIIGKKKKELFPLMMRCHIYGKKNCEGPKGWETNNNLPWYDPKGKYGKEIPGAISRGYTVEEMKQYFDTIEGFASYALK